jgi:DNA-binding CsgD family transcriptional regulator
MNNIQNQVEAVSEAVFQHEWETIKAETNADFEAALDLFNPYISAFPKLAMGSYYWQIFDNVKPIPKIHRVGGSVEELTPLDARTLLEASPEQIFSFIHPDDLLATKAFLVKGFQFLLNRDITQRAQFSFQILSRIRNGQGGYFWNSIQYPAFYFDSHQNLIYGLVLYTNISHLVLPHTVPSLTILDTSKAENQVFTCFTLQHNEGIQLPCPSLTNREKEVIGLLAKGYSSKQIAFELGIHKTTVDNHRQRLLKKFKATSSSELVLKVIMS